MSNIHTCYTGRPALLYRTVVGSFMVLLLSWCLPSCKKENIPPGTASLTMIHAMPGVRPLAANFSLEGPVPYITSRKIDYNGYTYNINQFNAYAGPQRLRMFQYPDTTDKDKPLFDLQLDLPIGSISTLFFTGTVNAPDTVLTRDAIPFIPAADSTMALRFINLSPGSAPVSVNLQGQANGSEATSLRFKGITEFKRYAVKPNLPDYVFEFRDAASGALIASYTTPMIYFFAPSRWLYRSFTVALIGVPGGSAGTEQKTFLVNHH